MSTDPITTPADDVVETVEIAEIAEIAVPATPDQRRTFGTVIEEKEYDPSEFDRLKIMYEGTLTTLKKGEIITGKIIQLTKDHAIIDIGFKSEGMVNIDEFTNSSELKIGDVVEVFLESVENKDGNVTLSRKRADFVRIWERIQGAFDNEEILQGRCIRRIKGGIVMDLMGVDAFLPGSQIDIRPVRDFDAYLGRTLDVRVVKINQPAENIVVSRKVIIEEQIAGQRKAILDSLEKGQILEGTVKAIADFGVFIDLGGVDGLVHITDLSWGRVNHPTEIVKLDQTVNVVVLDFDADKKRISLGMKQLMPHPWENIENKYPVGTKVRGKVVSLADYGAFIEIEKGIEGLIHISEMSWTQHIKHPSQVVSMGQMVDAVILNLDVQDKKISLGMKQLEPDPWSNLIAKYPVGSRHTGVVRNLTNFGVFVELEPGVDGLVHISDLSWTKKIRHPGEIVKKAEKIDVVILGIDIDQRRISLGHKQVQDNPWDVFESSYAVGIESEGKITRIIEKGVIVELPSGVDGFVPSSQLANKVVKNIPESFKEGDTLPLKVIEFDKENKKIVLSVVDYFKSRDAESIDAYLASHGLLNAPAADSTDIRPEDFNFDED
ncbi:MAG: 30S ribosomal protein S1 [Ignavibacteria bacterium]|nr:30S ribosomal protein S1 [Ignavibacteria bacterium]